MEGKEQSSVWWPGLTPCPRSACHLERGSAFLRGPQAGGLQGSTRTGAPWGDWRLWVSLAWLQPPRAQRHRQLLLTWCPSGLAQPEPAILSSVPPPRLGRAISLNWSSPRYFQLGPLPTSLGPRSLSLSGQDRHTLSALWLHSLARGLFLPLRTPQLIWGPSCLSSPRLKMLLPPRERTWGPANV